MVFPYLIVAAGLSTAAATTYDCPWNSWWSAPSGGATEVPVTASLVQSFDVHMFDDPSVGLFAVDTDSQVQGSHRIVESSGRERYAVFEPSELLQAETQYRFSLDERMTVDFTTRSLAPRSTAARPGPGAGRPVEIMSYRYVVQRGRRFGQAGSAVLALSLAPWSTTSGYVELLVVDPEQDRHHVLTSQERVAAFGGPCGPDNLPGLMSWPTLTISARGHDLATGPTDWSEPLAVELEAARAQMMAVPTQPHGSPRLRQSADAEPRESEPPTRAACSCSSASWAGSAPLVIGIALLAVRRRRLRRPSR